MRGHRISLVAAVCLFFHLAAASTVNAVLPETVWEGANDGIRDTDLQSAAVSPVNPDTVYVSSVNTVYKTSDGGKKWDEVLSFRGTGNSINIIDVSPEDIKTVYAGTQEGLYRSSDGGRKWEKIFRGVGGLEGSVLSIVVDPANPEVVFIGTGKGLFRSDNSGKEWNREHDVPADTRVTSLAIDRTKLHVYAATERGVYKGINGGNDWQRVFTTNPSEEKYEVQIINEGTITVGNVSVKNIVAADPSGTIYVSSSKGILMSTDGGDTWKTAGRPGLSGTDIRHLSAVEKDVVYAATGRGVYRYSKTTDDWEELYNGIITKDINNIAVTPDQTDNPVLWAVTKKGVFKTSSSIRRVTSGNDMRIEDISSKFDSEPTIEEIREAAVAYAEVSPEKINGWREAAAKRAWMPDLTFRYDKGRALHNDAYYYSGEYVDDTTSRDKDSGWYISLTWELGELIWNNDQTSIDSRSKLMVELRDDVLNEVTRLYFERRKLQIEMLLAAPVDIRGMIDKDLRLQELTAGIDALTGSYLSKRLSQTGNATARR